MTTRSNTRQRCLLAIRWGSHDRRPTREHASTRLGIACIYYAWWDPRYLILLLSSVGFNWILGKRLANGHSRGLLAFGISLNLGTLAYFKYAGM